MVTDWLRGGAALGRERGTESAMGPNFRQTGRRDGVDSAITQPPPHAVASHASRASSQVASASSGGILLARPLSAHSPVPDLPNCSLARSRCESLPSARSLSPVHSTADTEPIPVLQGARTHISCLQRSSIFASCARSVDLSDTPKLVHAVAVSDHLRGIVLRVPFPPAKP